ncbi:MAG: hypothetical protein LBV00_10425, partial [Propionibacteriaceae bacterium]|nr:hypothetical protein [Propionibacteriaceae bacterium]
TSLCVWVPFNEGWGQFDAARIAGEVRRLDSTRPIDHASGYFDQGAGDFDSYHVYFKHFRPKTDRRNLDPTRQRVMALTEFGGYSLASPDHMSAEHEFGYKVFRTQADLDSALESLYDSDVLAHLAQGLAAVVYTQVSDVEDEINGLFTYDRQVLKPDPALLRAVNQRLYDEFERLHAGEVTS